MNRWERAFRRLLFCLLGAPLALADGGVFQFIAANPHGPPPNGLLNPALLKGARFWPQAQEERQMAERGDRGGSGSLGFACACLCVAVQQLRDPRPETLCPPIRRLLL